MADECSFDAVPTFKAGEVGAGGRVADVPCGIVAAGTLKVGIGLFDGGHEIVEFVPGVRGAPFDRLTVNCFQVTQNDPSRQERVVAPGAGVLGVERGDVEQVVPDWVVPPGGGQHGSLLTGRGLEPGGHGARVGAQAARIGHAQPAEVSDQVAQEGQPRRVGITQAMGQAGLVAGRPGVVGARAQALVLEIGQQCATVIEEGVAGRAHGGGLGDRFESDSGRGGGGGWQVGQQFGRDEGNLVGSFGALLKGAEDKAAIPEPFGGRDWLSPGLLPLRPAWPHRAYLSPLAGKDPQRHLSSGSEQCLQCLALVVMERFPCSSDDLGRGHCLGQLGCHVPLAAGRQFHVPEAGNDPQPDQVGIQ